ncbi:MAG: hypothetical protein EZS28_045827 [Streblomastix strix]|uniref:Uncharacterized protein n=1 Tax=Streblomastix strix TaxID=222440 RepID=A0A5J4TJK9_9EUKA|nr:MAG: hypothetical protein EZS28_045827 [Streblomastix strix]
MANARHVANELGVSKVYEENDQSVVNISGGANSDHAPEIVENALNALRRLNPGDEWKEEFKICKNVAKQAHPQSKIFKV